MIPFEPIPDSAPRFNGLVTKVRYGCRVPPSSFPVNRGSIAPPAAKSFGRNISGTPGGFTRSCACTHTTATTLSGSHRPHQHHSITRGTLWNHLPNHLVTSTQRNATGPPHGQFRGLAAGRFGTTGAGRGEQRGFFGNGGWGRRGSEGGGVACGGYCISPRGTRCVSLPC